MDRKKLKNDLEYLWADYKWLVITGLVILFVVIYQLAAAFGKKETVLSVMLIDCHTDADPERMEEDFLSSAGYSTAGQQAEILTNLLFEDTDSGSYTMTSLSRFLADIGSEKLDVCAMLEEDFIKYENSDTWLDLSELLAEDELSSLEGSLLLKDGRAIGIYTDALPVLEGYGCYENGASSGVIGVVYNTPHREAARNYLLFAAGL